MWWLHKVRIWSNWPSSTLSSSTATDSLPKTTLVDSSYHGVQSVQEHVAEGAGYIKIEADVPVRFKKM